MQIGQITQEKLPDGRTRVTAEMFFAAGEVSQIGGFVFDLKNYITKLFELKGVVGQVQNIFRR